MDIDNKLMLEALDAASYEKQAQTKSKLYLAVDALKACYEHFSSEPTDPGHPALIKIVKNALDEIKKDRMGV